RAGLFFVSLAGVTANLLIALAALAVLAWLGLRLDASGDAYLAPGAALARLPGKLGQGVFLGLYWAAHINLVLAVFNLLPIPPLDGSKVVQSLAPAGWQPLFARLERFGFLLVVAVLLLFNRQVFALIARLEGLVMHLILG
ncbi:MAG TPA: site-2 protease family protein, partial [Trueperaceae bacterium]